jgi:hypothetical protein
MPRVVRAALAHADVCLRQWWRFLAFRASPLRPNRPRRKPLSPFRPSRLKILFDHPLADRFV